jgi:uncharacterized protein (DUF1501 family)
MPISRRHFLQALSATGAAAAGIGGLEWLVRAPASGPPTAAGPSTSTTTTTAAAVSSTAAAGAPSTPGTLVLVTLYGGNDALNTVAPVEDPTYRSARGPLALDAAAAHALADGFALHPALVGLKGMWDAQRLAIVHGVGFADLDRSHFHCMDVWQAGSEDERSTGWLGRWLDAVGTTPLDAIAVGRELPLALRGAKRSAAVVPAGPFTLPGDAVLRRDVGALSAADSWRPPLASLVASSTADLLAVVDKVAPVLAKVSDGSDPLDESDDDAVATPAAGRKASGLADQLAVVAAGIEAGLPARVYSVAVGSFDTHANQAATHQALLTELDGALSDFVDRIGSRPVTAIVYSEFGRRVAANGSAGTDHGTAGTVLLAGTVKPGFHGDPPPLDRLADGDLATTVDFRSVYGGVLEGVLGMEAGDLFPGGPAPLQLV